MCYNRRHHTVFDQIRLDMMATIVIEIRIPNLYATCGAKSIDRLEFQISRY